MWNDKRYHTYDYEMKKIFGEKAVKLSVDGGFTCPNRDGTIGLGGCIFCSESGSGEFTPDMSIEIPRQLEMQKSFMSKKWITKTYIAYFQNHTNTYDSVDKLRTRFDAALSCENICGLAVATRPDCIDKEKADMLAELSERTFLWVELGLQTIHEDTAKFIRRGYGLGCFDEAMNMLRERKIRTVVHLIAGLPGESKDMFLKSADYVSSAQPWGIKLHLLHVLKNTDLAIHYREYPFKVLSLDEYVDTVCDTLEILDPGIVIHRLTGDGKKSDLIAPLWSLDKLRVLSAIDGEMAKRQSFQGKYQLL